MLRPSNTGSAVRWVVRTLAVAALVVIPNLRASAEEYRDPVVGLLCVGTNGTSISSTPQLEHGCDIAVSHGGCAWGGWAAVAVGESTTGCENGDKEAHSVVGIGLLGADAGGGLVSASDTGDAFGDGFVSVSGTGSAYSTCAGFSLSPYGSTCSGGFALSGTGNASSSADAWNQNPCGLSVEGIPVSCGTAVAVSGTGGASATGTPCPVVAFVGPCGGLAVAGGDAYGTWIAISATGSARGGSVLNVGGGGCGC